MEISWLQAIILGIFACLASMPGLGGTSIGNYTLGRPLIGGLVCGIVLGDVTTGILVGCAMQVVYIALVTLGGTVSADVRAVLIYRRCTSSLCWYCHSVKADCKKRRRLYSVPFRIRTCSSNGN